MGSNEITPLGLTGAYAAVANHGAYCKPMPVLQLRSLDESEVFRKSKPRCDQVVDRKVADRTADILKSVVDRGTGRPAQFGRPAAGKTGTTDDASAVWFAGFTPQYAAAVWVGDPRGGYRYPLRSITINGRFHPIGYGSVLAAPTWKAAMEAVHEGKPVENFSLDLPAAPRPATTTTTPTTTDGSTQTLP